MSKLRVLQRQALRREAEAAQSQQPQQPQQPPQQPPDLFGALIAGVVSQALRQNPGTGGQHDEAVLSELRALRAEIADLKAQLATRPAQSGREYTFAVERDLNGRMSRVHARPATGKPS